MIATAGSRIGRPEPGLPYSSPMTNTKAIVERFIETLEFRDWDGWSALLHPDVVYELPQSRERVQGKHRYLRFNQEYPGDWHLRLKVAIADDRNGVAWFSWRVGDDEPGDAMAFFTFADGLVT